MVVRTLLGGAAVLLSLEGATTPPSGPRVTLDAHVVADDTQPLVAVAAIPLTAADMPVPRRAERIVRAAGVTTIVDQYTQDGGRLTVTTRVATLPSGTLELRITLASDRATMVRLAPPLTAAPGVEPFAISRDAAPGDYVSPEPTKSSPLPVLGLASGGRTWFVASGATWDDPLPGHAIPLLTIHGRTFAAPQIGTADAPVRLVPGQPRTWRTLIGRAPAAPVAERRYAVALGAQLAVARDEGGLRFAPVIGDLHAAARDRFAAITFATAYWARVTSPDGKRSVTPAPHYAPGTWMRDSFWTVLGLAGTRFERATEATIVASSAHVTPRTGRYAGRVPLLIAEPSTIAFDDESGLYMLIRMERDARVLGIAPDRGLARLILAYILAHQVDGARFITAGAEPFRGHPFSPNGWLDGYHYAKGDVITANQGLFVLALKAAARLGVAVPEGLAERARKEYRASYDPSLGYMRWLASTDYRSPDVLIPEALSLWLWNEPLLDDRAVRDTLAAQSWSDYGMRVLTTRDGGWVPASAFLNTTNEGRPAETPGWYQNGGSWLLWEYLAAYAARRHGDLSACAAMRRSVAAEVAVEPISKEFKLTRVADGLDAVDPGGNRVLGSTDEARQGYGWNTAILAFDRDLAARGLSCTG